MALLVLRLAKGDGARFSASVQTGLRPTQVSVQYVLGFVPRRKVAVMRKLSPSIAEDKEGLSLDINNPSGPVQVSSLPITHFNF